ncbi:MAG: GNAT family N-acetyltransferase [Pseudomonadota bacterium]
MTDFEIRRANEDDAPAIYDIHRSSILTLGPGTYTAEECESWAFGLTVEGYRTNMTKDGEVYLVAEDAVDALGFSSFKDDEVTGLYVYPSAIRRSVGTSLLADAEQRIFAAGSDRIRISAALSALDFYRAQGYAIDHRRLWKTRGGLEITVCEMVKSTR